MKIPRLVIVIFFILFIFLSGYLFWAFLYEEVTLSQLPIWTWLLLALFVVLSISIGYHMLFNKKKGGE